MTQSKEYHKSNLSSHQKVRPRFLQPTNNTSESIFELFNGAAVNAIYQERIALLADLIRKETPTKITMVSLHSEYEAMISGSHFPA